MTSDAELMALREMQRWLSRQIEDAMCLANDESLDAEGRACARGEWMGYMAALAEIDRHITEARK